MSCAALGSVGDGECGRWGVWEMGSVGDGECGRWGLETSVATIHYPLFTIHYPLFTKLLP